MESEVKSFSPRCSQEGSGLGSSPADFSRGDLAQRKHDIPVIRDNQRFGAFQELFGARRRQFDQLETARHLVETIFNGDSCHDPL